MGSCRVVARELVPPALPPARRARLVAAGVLAQVAMLGLLVLLPMARDELAVGLRTGRELELPVGLVARLVGLVGLPAVAAALLVAREVLARARARG